MKRLCLVMLSVLLFASSAIAGVRETKGGYAYYYNALRLLDVAKDELVSKLKSSDAEFFTHLTPFEVYSEDKVSVQLSDLIQTLQTDIQPYYLMSTCPNVPKDYKDTFFALYFDWSKQQQSVCATEMYFKTFAFSKLTNGDITRTQWELLNVAYTKLLGDEHLTEIIPNTLEHLGMRTGYEYSGYSEYDSSAEEWDFSPKLSADDYLNKAVNDLNARIDALLKKNTGNDIQAFFGFYSTQKPEVTRKQMRSLLRNIRKEPGKMVIKPNPSGENEPLKFNFGLDVSTNSYYLEALQMFYVNFDNRVFRITTLREIERDLLHEMMHVFAPQKNDFESFADAKSGMEYLNRVPVNGIGWPQSFFELKGMREKMISPLQGIGDSTLEFEKRAGRDYRDASRAVVAFREEIMARQEYGFTAIVEQFVLSGSDRDALKKVIGNIWRFFGHDDSTDEVDFVSRPWICSDFRSSSENSYTSEQCRSEIKSLLSPIISAGSDARLFVFNWKSSEYDRHFITIFVTSDANPEWVATMDFLVWADEY